MCCRIAGNLDPFTPTILSLSTCDPGCEPSTHGEELAGGANLAQTTEVEQGKPDDLRASWDDCRYFILSAHARRSDAGCKRATSGVERGRIPTFLSDFDAPEPVHPVVYSPWMYRGGCS